MADSLALARLLDAIPMCLNVADRSARFPSPLPNRRAQMLGTGTQVQSYSAWVSVAPQDAVHDVKRYGAMGDGRTNDRAAIQAAITAAQEAGGGTIYFPPGAYAVSGFGTVSLPTPVSGANFSVANGNLDYHFYIVDGSNLRFVGPGATITSTKTDGGVMLLFNGARSISFEGIGFRSATVVSGGIATTGGMTALGFTSTTRQSERIAISHARFTNVFAAVYIFGDPAGAFRVRGVQLDTITIDEALYGIAAHDNGDLLSFHGLRTIDVGRSYFAFGVAQHDGELEILTGNSLEAVLLKAYSRDTRDIALRIHSRKTTGSTPTVAFQSQHNPGAQPVPRAIINARIWLDDTDATCSGSIAFAYLQDSTPVATVATVIFTGIELSGYARGTITTTVQQTPSHGLLDTSALLLPTGLPENALYVAGGFRR